MMGPKALIGARSLGAAQFKLNPQYPVGTTLASKCGYFGLGVHRTLNLALEPNYGTKAWQEFVQQAQAAMSTVHTGTGTIPYNTLIVAAYFSSCYMVDLQLRELKHMIEMLYWSVPETLEAMQDYWGPSYQTAIDVRALKSQYCNRLNGLADTFYTKYPFIKPNFITFLGDLISQPYRDDKNKRTNYIYFNLFDKPWDAVVGGNYFDPKPFDLAFSRLEAWINGDSTHSVFSAIPETSLMMLIGDMRQVFGQKCWQSLQLSYPQDGPEVQYSQELIDSLNQSVTGDMELHTVSPTGWNPMSHTFLQTQGATWSVSRPQIQQWVADTVNKAYAEGPTWTTYVNATWTTPISTGATAFGLLARAINDGYWDYPVYHAFDGPTILSEFAFTTITKFSTYHAGTEDLTPTFGGSDGSLTVKRYGLFGIYITDTVSYVKYVTGGSNLLYAQGLNYWYQTESIDAIPRPTVPPINSTAASTWYSLITNSRMMACTMDAMTNWDLIYTANGGNYYVVSDEDVDEWSILPTVDLIANYGATAKGMFETATAINSQSNKVINVELDTKASGFHATRESGSRNDKRAGKRWNNNKGKKGGK